MACIAALGLEAFIEGTARSDRRDDSLGWQSSAASSTWRYTWATPLGTSLAL